MGSGKSTAAQILHELYGFEIVSLATPLRHLAELAKSPSVKEPLANSTVSVWSDFAYMLKLFEDTDNAIAAHQRYLSLCYQCAEELKSEAKPRNFLQRLGTEVGRAIEPDVWVRHLLKTTQTRGCNFVCDDLRFENEATLLRASGWELWRMEISEEVREVRLARVNGGVLPEDHNERQLHLSETELDGWDGRQGWSIVLAGCEDYSQLKGMVEAAVWAGRAFGIRPSASVDGECHDAAGNGVPALQDDNCQQPQAGTPAPRGQQGGGCGE